MITLSHYWCLVVNNWSSRSILLQPVTWLRNSLVKYSFVLSFLKLHLWGTAKVSTLVRGMGGWGNTRTEPRVGIYKGWDYCWLLNPSNIGGAWGSVVPDNILLKDHAGTIWPILAYEYFIWTHKKLINLYIICNVKTLILHVLIPNLIWK